MTAGGRVPPHLPTACPPDWIRPILPWRISVWSWTPCTTKAGIWKPSSVSLCWKSVRGWRSFLPKGGWYPMTRCCVCLHWNWKPGILIWNWMLRWIGMPWISRRKAWCPHAWWLISENRMWWDSWEAWMKSLSGNILPNPCASVQGLTGIWTNWNWPLLPQNFPVHWNCSPKVSWLAWRTACCVEEISRCKLKPKIWSLSPRWPKE